MQRSALRSTTTRTTTGHPGRPGARDPDRRARHAALLHQRSQDRRRAAVRRVPAASSTKRFEPRQGIVDARHARIARVRNAPAERARPTPLRPPPQRATQPAPPQPDPAAVYRVPVNGEPQRGANDALVTIVQFSDFQCPFCGRVEPTISQIEERYGRDVRVVWMNNPLPFHPNARPGCGGGHGGVRSGRQREVLGDARQAVREPAGHRARRPRALRARDRPQHGAVPRCARRQRAPGRHRAVPDARASARCVRHAELLRQRAQHPRRSAARGVHGAHRRRARKGSREGRRAVRRARASTRRRPATGRPLRRCSPRPLALSRLRLLPRRNRRPTRCTRSRSRAMRRPRARRTRA